MRTTLRAALNLAVKEGVLDCNPARHIEITGYQQPHAKVWTEALVESWEQTGVHPAVAVWTADQLAEFLRSVNDDPLFAFWWLAGLRGLRRSECGLRWSDIDLDRSVLTIERNRTTVGYQVVEGDPKTPAGRRAVALDKRSVQILRVHRRYEQDRRAEAAENGKPWTDSGYVFTRSDGLPINPNYATTRFRLLARRAGLPPVRLHDLRHGAASLAHEAGADLKTLQDLLGHSSIILDLRHLHQRPPADPAPLRRRHRPAGAERGPPHPQEDQDQGPQEPPRPRTENSRARPGQTENRCFGLGEAEVGREAAGHDAVSARKRRCGGGTHVAPT